MRKRSLMLVICGVFAMPYTAGGQITYLSQQRRVIAAYNSQMQQQFCNDTIIAPDFGPFQELASCPQNYSMQSSSLGPFKITCVADTQGHSGGSFTGEAAHDCIQNR